MRWLLTSLVSTAIFCGCASLPDRFVESHWTEEVTLHNGDVLKIRRNTIPGAIWYTDYGRAFYRVEQVIHLPGGVVWNSATLNPGVTSVTPAVLDRDVKSWILVTTTSSIGDQQRMGCPVPNFLYFRYVEGRWKRVNSRDIPDDLRFNLYIRDSRIAEPSPYLTHAAKSALRAAWLKENWAGTRGGKSWFSNPLRYMEEFSKFCDPRMATCVQPPTTDCNPEYLIIKP